MKTFRELFLRALKVQAGLDGAGLGRASPGEPGAEAGPGLTGRPPHGARRRTRHARSSWPGRRHAGCGARRPSRVRGCPEVEAGRARRPRYSPSGFLRPPAPQPGEGRHSRRRCVSSTPCWQTSGRASGCARRLVAGVTPRPAARQAPQTPPGLQHLVRAAASLTASFRKLSLAVQGCPPQPGQVPSSPSCGPEEAPRPGTRQPATPGVQQEQSGSGRPDPNAPIPVHSGHQ